MIASKNLPFEEPLLRELAETYGTPLYIYDEAGIRRSAKVLKEAFAWSKGYVNYFAVKATPTPAILKLLAEEGMGFDCSSAAELALVKQGGWNGRRVFYTSNNTPDEDYRYAQELGAVINLDKLPYLEQVAKAVGGYPSRMAIRYNPGGEGGNDIIGRPGDSKFGDTEDHVLKALEKMRSGGVSEIGLHAMVASNERDPAAFGRIAELLRRLAERAAAELSLGLSFINLGGGVGIPYRPEEEPTDIAAIGQAAKTSLSPLNIPVYTECGRFVTGPNGYLLTAVTHGVVESYRRFLTVDTSINNLCRLSSAGPDVYHHVSALGKKTKETKEVTVVGSMCVNSDRMFKDRSLPADIKRGDLLVVHDVGAHGRANSTNYNGRLRCGEVLVRTDGSHKLIRRHENFNDLFATVEGL
ncbi:diaminopimelate decarboxylase [Candidatus Saccharibacteria bacterium]|nr:diaminopimelate decarboxylase [Candidatus Saccharibacteria bacterium]